MNNYNSTNPSPPAISLTPSNLNNTASTSRSRSGTLPSSFLTTSSSNSQSMSNSASPLVTGHTSDSLGLPTMESISISPSPNSHAIDIPGRLNGGTRRMRSGSLFSTNSIWNDDPMSVHSPSQTNTGFVDASSLHSFDNSASNHNNGSSGSGGFLSPLLTVQNVPLSSNGTNNGVSNSSNNNVNHRNRSYSTTAAVPNVNALTVGNGAYSVLDPLNPNRMSTSPFVAPPNKASDMNSLLDNLMVNMNNNTAIHTRNRSQTYSGAAPTIAESTIQSQQVISHNLIQQQHQQHQQQLLGQQPLLQDDFDLSQLVITTNFDNPNLGPTKLILFDNVPQFIDSIKLWSILNNSLGNQRALGGVRSVRVTNTNTSKLALVECTSVDIAMSLKANFNHLELVPGVVLYVAFAKFAESASSTNETPITNSSGDNSRPMPTDILAIQGSLMQSINKLASTAEFVDLNKIISIINKSISYPNENYQNNFGPLPDPIPLRQFDSPKLRELRKILENSENNNSSSVIVSDSEDNELANKTMSQLELEELCLAMLDELPELCYDYLGNTIVQKIFSVVKSPLIKLMMVKEIAPFLTQISIHKNGTWAIQKIINLCDYDYQQKYLIGASLKPYAVKLFNDQFGNYVLQGCIKFGSPFNDFVFEAMLDNFIEISFGRFGARCIRTILEMANESYVITNEQVILVAGLIVEYANDLVVNSNGSLLITWFLDTFNGCGAAVDDRFELLTKKFLPNLSKLCTHKLANLTILKILNNRSDLKSKQLTMEAIFGKFKEYDNVELIMPPSKLLEVILTENQENTAGPLFIYKILSNPLLLSVGDESDSIKNTKYQQFITSQIRRILLEININNFQPYKKLMDEVGLSSTRLNRSSSMSRRNKRNGRNNTSKNQSQQAQQPSSQGIVNPYVGNPPNSQFAFQYQQQQPQQYPMMVAPQVMLSNGQPPLPSQQELYQQQQSSQDVAVMQQLEQLSLSSAALGYNSNPGTPGVASSQRNLFF